tara:strand:- start:608 stop:1030 length:423 start_codon:yes stop_codon:yes gene_type:complete
MLQVKLNHIDARMPTRGSDQSAGYDLYSVESVTIPPRTHKLIKTGISIALPEETYGRIAPRSGLAYKYGIDVFAGVIDRDYRGEIGVILFNSSDVPFQVNVSDRIAQLIVERIALIPIIQAGNTLDMTERGEGGFGSTGV